MAKDYRLNVEERSVFLSPAETDGQRGKKGERDSTSPMRTARFVHIDRIRPDPDQPRKHFRQEPLESLAASIREIGEIIDPITVAYEEKYDLFRIISGERRYRAAKMAGLEELPCILKEAGNEKKKALLQLMANLQREDMTPLEESAAIRAIIEKFGYSQLGMAKLLNRSESYISQILGLERLSQPARKILQTSEVAKELQIRASREKDPRRQEELLKRAAEKGATVRQIRTEGNSPGNQKDENNSENDKGFRKWRWCSKNGAFVVTVHFTREQGQNRKTEAVKAALEVAHGHLSDLLDRKTTNPGRTSVVEKR